MVEMVDCEECGGDGRMTVHVTTDREYDPDKPYAHLDAEETECTRCGGSGEEHEEGCPRCGGTDFSRMTLPHGGIRNRCQNCGWKEVV